MAASLSDDDLSFWQVLPDCVLLEVFSYLNVIDLSRSAQTCRSWYRVCCDEHLWRNLFVSDWKLNRSARLAPGRTSWRSEYRRLRYEVPAVEGEVLCEHSDQVLHVSFSNYGEMFASCSKDGFVVVWNSSYPVSVRYKYDMKKFNWTYTQFSQFNESDTLLLVSGVFFQPISMYGEIAVFTLEGEFELQCRVKNKPYDIFGSWYCDDFLLSGGYYFLGNHASSSVIYLYKASQESDSEHKSVMSQLYKFFNKNGSLRSIMVANFQSAKDLSDDADSSEQVDGIRTMRCVQNGSDLSLPAMFNNCDNVINVLEEKEEEEAEVGAVILDSREKYLIFTTGSQSYVPHQIGFKTIKPFKFNWNLNVDIEKLLTEYRERELHDRTRPNYQDEEAVRQNFDKIDHCIELHGHIIGMALSPDHRYLFVNCRSWPKDYVIGDPMAPPPIAQEIDILVFDLLTMCKVDALYRSHKAYTSNDECFFIFLDVSNSYVASGAEDKNGYLWDRHYQMCLSRFPHSGVVNSVAFNPVNEGMLVTASDDHRLKVWRSKTQARYLNTQLYVLPT